MARQGKTKCQKLKANMGRCCKKIVAYLGCGKHDPYINQYPIDRFIDEYWLMNCPDSKSIGEINKEMSNLLHRLYCLQAGFATLEQERQREKASCGEL